MKAKHLVQRVGAAVLAVTLALSACPVPAFAEDAPAVQGSVQEQLPAEVVAAADAATAETATAADAPDSAVPPPDQTMTLAETGDTYTKISAAEELTSGDYVLLASSGYAMGVLDGTWVSSVAVTPEGDTVTAAPVWTLTVDSDTAVLTDANGAAIAPKGGNNNGIISDSYAWTWSIDENGTFSFAGQDTDTVTLACNVSSQNRFRAYKNVTVTTYPNTYPSQFTLYKKAGGTEPTTPPTPEPTTPPTPEPTAPIADGDTVVIWAPAYGKALSSVYNGFYNTGVDVTAATDGSLTGYSDSELWTVSANEDGSYSFLYNGQKLGMAASYSSLTLGAVNDKWTLEDAGDGKYYVKNTVRGSYIEWYDAKSNWSGYGTIAEGSEGLFALCFTKATNVPAPSPTPEPQALTVQAAPASGASLSVGDTVTLTAAEGLEIYYTLATGAEEPADPEVTKAEQKYTAPIAVTALPTTIKAVAYRPAAEGIVAATGSVVCFTYKEAIGMDGLTPYFGQLHSHTNISDGAGSVEDAFDHASKVENLDFLAVTDHSNSFDNDTNAGVGLANDCTAISSEFAEGRKAAAEITAADNHFVGLYGFEMTWSDGFGHINTFNTPGFESRSNSAFGNKSGNDTGYQLYYQKLTEVPQSLSQFNHPGTTFGDFSDFAFYTAAVDQRINLIEVGNGEGAVGQSGYFPSYEYYTRALDKGWHVAPTNNQDNHKGNWGDSNTARSVVLAADLSQQSIYDAIGNYRVYATEDNDLTILYSLNGNVMGSILGKQADGVHIAAQISDPTDTDNAKVEVIVNGGLVAATQTLSGGNGTVNFDLDSNDYSYYYLRVTQADKQIAVTAPVWTGEGVNAGLASTTCDTELVVKDEPVTITSALYNNTQSTMTVQSLSYTVNGETIEAAAGDKLDAIKTVAPSASANYSFDYTPTVAGKTNINVTLVATVDGTEQTFTGVLSLSVTDESLVTRILVDGTHYNDYVTGYYADRMGNFAALAADKNAQVTVKQPGESITAADLAEVSMLVISAPLKYAGNNIAAGAQASTFEPEFIQLVADYAKNGGTVILCGLADYQDSNDGAPYCSTEQINPILESMGATMRLNDDEVLDDDTAYNGGATQTYRVYMDNFNTAAFPELFEGLQSGQRYSAYSGASVNVGANGVALVSGSANCYSINAKTRPAGAKGSWDSGKAKGSTTSGSYDADTAVVTKGNVVTLATEAVGSGRVYLAGTVFCSNFEISDSSSVDYGDASYANKVILDNLLDGVQKPVSITPIKEVRAAYQSAADKGKVFTVQGKVTAGNVDGNAFFDTIYIQDATGGLDIYPVSSTDGTFLLGQTVQVTGSLDAYQGDIELRTISISLIDTSTTSPVAPTEFTLAQAGDYAANGGKLAKVTGTVKATGLTGGVLDYAILTDGTNDLRIFINNYIGYSKNAKAKAAALESFVTEGAQITAVGIVYTDPEGVCLRVRDRSEITVAATAPTATPSATPSATPTATPTAAPSAAPTAAPSAAPTAAPSAAPTAAPSAAPTTAPSAAPTTAPTAVPSAAPVAGTSGQYTINAWVTTGGSISPIGNTLYQQGAQATYTITPADGYRIAKVVIDGTDMGALHSYTFSSINKNHEIGVYFDTVNAVSKSNIPQTGDTAPLALLWGLCLVSPLAVLAFVWQKRKHKQG